VFHFASAGRRLSSFFSRALTRLLAVFAGLQEGSERFAAALEVIGPREDVEGG
jgi:hypothetical protein